MSRYDVDFDAARRQAMRTARAALVAGTATQAQKDQLLRDITELLIDDAQFTAEDREYSRSLNADGYPNAPEYRHEFLMNNDGDYRAAWAYDHWEPYQIEADAEPNKMDEVVRGRSLYPYRESDPEIVDRSLLRNGYRPLREGETMPGNVIGRYAPKLTAILPSIPRTETVTPFG